MDEIEGLKVQRFYTKVKKAVEPVGENIPIPVILLFLGIMAGSASAAVPTFTEITPSTESGTKELLINFSEGVSRTPNGSSPLNISSFVVAGTDGSTIHALDHVVGSRDQDMLQSPGRLTANGMHFEINDSNYLNITLDSSETVNITLESAPKMVAIKFESTSGPLAAKITLGGFVPLTTYNKYEDNYHNLVSFQTDINGNYTYTQELSKPHFVFIQPHKGKSDYSDILATSYVLPGTIFIQDNATGGDCILVGTWNIGSKTCTLTTDFASNIQIDNDSIVLDGNGHTITGNDTGNGVHLSGRSDVTIKDLNIMKFYNGIFLYTSSNNMLRSNNNVLNKGDGISLWSSSNNILSSNKVLSSYGGIYLYYYSNNNTLSNNKASNNSAGIYLASSGNTLNNNNASNNRFFGIGLGDYYSNNNILINNTASNNGATGIILLTSSNNILNNNNASNNNNNGISLNISSNNNTLIDNIASNNKNYGIFLGDSSNNTLNGNNATNNDLSIYLFYSSNNTLNGNNATNNDHGIYLFYSSNNTLNGNNAKRNNNRGILLYHSINNTLTSNNANSPSGYGIFLDSSSNNMLSGNNANSNGKSGISLYNSSNNTLSCNNAKRNNWYGMFGISLDWSSNNEIRGNSVSNNFRGISLYSSRNNTISGNNVSNNSDNGIFLLDSSNNEIRGNNASNNSGGIYISYSSNNLIYNNYFNNANNIYISTFDSWNITKQSGINIIGGPYLGGNFWANPDGTGFSQTCADSDNEGICDSGYALDGQNIDYLPLTIASIPFAVNINISGMALIGVATSKILNVEYTNFNSGDPYNISIIAPNGTRLYYDSGTLTGINPEIIPINWIPSSRGNYTIEAWGRGMIESTPVYVFDSGVVSPTPELGTIVLVATGILGLMGIRRRY